LWLLDLLLLAAVTLVGLMLRDRWVAADAREQALLRQMIPAVPTPALPQLPTVAPVTAAAYVDVAQQLLFSRDRNPTVILDPPPPPPAPPPPKPMPDLPAAYGVLDLGTGLRIILAEKAGSVHHGYQAGQTVGAFKIVSLTPTEITFDWEGKKVTRRIEQILDRSTAKSAENAPQAPAKQPEPNKLNSVAAKTGPGQELGEKTRACVPGDPTPAGTVQDGFRKVVTKTPFGDSCRWEAVQ
jgi:hypothetical protein